MREDTFTNSRTKPCRPGEHNQHTKATLKTNGNPSKPKYSLWGSQIVKGFTTEKKTKQQTTIQSKKQTTACTEISSHKDLYEPYNSRVKRSLVGDFPCPANAAQVHPHAFECSQISSPASRDVFLELDHLRELLRESKERELQLRSELLLYKEDPRVSELEKEIDSKRTDIDKLTSKVTCLEAEKSSLSEQLHSLSSILQQHKYGSSLEEFESTSDQKVETNYPSYRNLELEVVELRRVNKELLFQKRRLSLRLSSAESELTALAKVAEGDIVAKVQAEASVLRHTNENLSKQVEGLQMSRLNEVEELAYLRWVNSCLRHELSNSDKASDSKDNCNCNNSNRIMETDSEDRTLPCLSKFNDGDICNHQMGLVNNLVKWSENNEDYSTMLDKRWTEAEEDTSPRRRHSIGGSKEYIENLTMSRRRQSDSFLDPIEKNSETSTSLQIHARRDKQQLLGHEHDLIVVQTPRFVESRSESCKISILDVEKRALRIPNPPPRPPISVGGVTKDNKSTPVPPPPPPPPPPLPKFSARSTGVMKRAPQVAELYHSLMKRDSRKDSYSGGICDVPDAANVRSSMIGEIENRSSHLMAIKADVETQGEFVKSLIKEVNGAAYSDIEDVVAFVKWLDDELCFLVDERAVLKHFDWPEKKADTLREAAFGYLDLKKLESEVSSYEDNPRLPCDVALKKMVALSEKMEQSIYNILRTRDVMVRRFKEFRIPTDWMLDSGIVSKENTLKSFMQTQDFMGWAQDDDTIVMPVHVPTMIAQKIPKDIAIRIKFGSVKLAKKYMKRVASELKSMGVSNKDPALEYTLLQGVRFAFRIHQFAGGFDAETMQVFEELRNVAYVRNKV